jgi:apolipoprotein D and lipocalin family protein
MTISRKNHCISLIAFLGLTACTTKPPLQTVDYVDIDRFMGDWYVLANIPTFLEKDAYNAVETYRLDDDGTIETTFVFRKGAFDGKRKEYNPRAWIHNAESNAVWGMQFLWPIKADYRIVYLDADYSRTIIARNKRDFVWLMARTPSINESDYNDMVHRVDEMGYDISRLQRVPQKW